MPDFVVDTLKSLFGKDPNIQDLNILNEQFEPSPQSVELLANACRQEEWRLPLQEAGFLSKSLQALTGALSRKDEALSYQILRYVCNSAADTDENRTLILPFMNLLISGTHEQGLTLAALSAVLNVCRDFPAGQASAVELNVLSDLEEVLEFANRQEVHIALDIFGLVLPVWVQSGAKIPTELIARAVLETARAPGIAYHQDDFLTCMDFLLPILQEEEVLKILADKEQRHLVLDLVESVKYRLYGRMESNQADVELEAEDSDSDSEEEQPALSKALSSAILVASSAASLWTLDLGNLSDDDEFKDLVSWLSKKWRNASDNHQLDDMSCPESLTAALMLGNLVRSDEVAEAIARYNGVLDAAIDIVKEASDAQIKDAAAGLLSNLAVARQNKDLMREKGAFGAVEALLAKGLKDGALVLDGIKLLRRLIRDSVSNVKLFLLDKKESINQQFVKLLSEMGDASPVDQILPKLETEIALFVVDLLRTISTIQNEDVVAATESFLSIPIVSNLLVSLTNHPDPGTRSKAIMGLALFTRYPSSSRVFWKQISKTEKNSPIRNMLLDAESKPDENESVFVKEDKQNLGMMIGHLVQGNIPDMSEEHKSRLGKKMANLASEHHLS